MNVAIASVVAPTGVDMATTLAPRVSTATTAAAVRCPPAAIRIEPSASPSYHPTRSPLGIATQSAGRSEGCRAVQSATAASQTATSVVTVKQLGSGAGYGPRPSHTTTLSEQSVSVGGTPRPVWFAS